ncbi:unnamed protein product [Sphagnum balticum]
MAYLSPEQLTSLRKGHYSQMPDNKGKTQIFSLGMTVMEAMLLCSSIDLYEMNLLRLVEQKVQQRRDIMVKLYSAQLSDLVLSMLAIDQHKRPSFTEVLNHPLLRSYNSKISLSHNNVTVLIELELISVLPQQIVLACFELLEVGIYAFVTAIVQVSRDFALGRRSPFVKRVLSSGNRAIIWSAPREVDRSAPHVVLSALLTRTRSRASGRLWSAGLSRVDIQLDEHDLWLL